MKLLVDTYPSQANVKASMDANPANQYTSILDRLVIAPEQLADASTTMLVASTARQDAILDTIKTLGIQNPVLPLRP